MFLSVFGCVSVIFHCGAVHLYNYFIRSAPSSTSRYSETGSEHSVEVKLQELLDAHLALKETVDKAMVRMCEQARVCMRVFSTLMSWSNEKTRVEKREFV